MAPSSNRSNPILTPRRLAVLLASTALAASPAAAATYTATDEASLIAAINAANANAGSDTITLLNAIALTGALPTITDVTTVDAGAYQLSIPSGSLNFAGSGSLSLANGSQVTGSGSGNTVIFGGSSLSSLNVASGSTINGDVSAAGGGGVIATIVGTLGGTLTGSGNADSLIINGGNIGAASLGSGSDTVIFKGGTIGGVINAGAFNSDSFTATLGAGKTASVDLSNLTNFESYALTSGTLVMSGDGQAQSDWAVTSGASVTLSGALHGYSTALSINGNTNGSAVNITSTGSIDGYGGIFFNGAPSNSLTNAGTIATAQAAVSTNASTAINNSGTISSGASDGITTGFSVASIINTGTISGATAGVAARYRAIGVNNQAGGFISGTTAGFVGGGFVGNGGLDTITNASGAGITGATAISTTDNAGLSLINSGQVIGSVAAIRATGSGSVNIDNRAGGIIAVGTLASAASTYVAGSTGTAITLANGGTITNAGTIAGSTAINFSGAGSISNLTGGTISGTTAVGGSGVVNLNFASGSTAGDLTFTGSGNRNVTLDGTIGALDGSAATGSLNVTLGTTAQLSSLSFGAGNDLLADYGAGIAGAIDGGAGTDTYAIGVATGQSRTVALGTAFSGITNFEQLGKVGSGTLTLTGALSVPIQTILAGDGGNNDGLLIFDGTLGLTAGITVNGAIIRATTAGSFGNGTIRAVDPTIQYGATGGYSNNIVLAVPAPASTDPTRLEALNGSTATLTGSITSDPTADPKQYVTIGGNGTIVLNNTANSWSGVTTIDSGATLRGTTGSISGGSIVDNGTLVYFQSASGTVAKNVSGTGGITVFGLNAGNTLTFSGNLTNAGVTVNDASTVAFGGIDTLSGANAVTLGASGTTVNVLDNASLTGANYGIQSSAANQTVNNLGTITGTNTVGVYLANGAIINNGSATDANASILGGSTGAGINSGTLTVNNYGLIQGTKGSGVVGDGTINNYAGGQIVGKGTLGGSFGAGIDGQTLTVNNAGSITGQAAGVRGSVLTIDNQAGGTITTTGSAANNAAVAASNALTLTNAGALNGTVFGVYNGGAGATVITNGTGASITANTSTSNTISAAGALTLNNAGVISNPSGIAYCSIASVGTATIVNSGTISGGSMCLNGTANSVTNSGTIKALGGTGFAAFTLTVNSTLDNSGIISSVGGGVRATGSGASIVNSGSISAAVAYAGAMDSSGSIINSGTLAGGSDATLGYGAVLGRANGNITLTNQSGGVIGGGIGSIKAVGSGLVSIVLQAGSVANGNVVSFDGGARALTVNGTLNGNYDASAGTGADTVTVGASGSMGNVLFGAGNDRFVSNGGTFGTLDGGLGTDTFVADLASGISASLDLASVTAFESLGKTGAGTLTLTGAADPAILTYLAGDGGNDDGILVFNGTTGVTGDIYVNGAILRADTAGAFGTGTIHTIDPTVQYGATGTYANNILLAVPAPASADPTRLEAINGSTATLTGAITSDPAADPNQYVTIGGNGTIDLTNTGNSWSGVTTIDSGAILLGTSGTISGGSIVDNGTLAYNQSASGTVAQNVSGTGGINVSGVASGNTLTFGGNLTNAAVTVTDASSVAFGGIDSFSGNSGVILSASGSTVSVLDNASLTGVQFGINGTAGNQTVNNLGTIRGTNSIGVRIGGGTINNGSATDSNASILGSFAGSSNLGAVTVNNYGLIKGTNGYGIDSTGAITLNNYAGATVSGPSTGVNSNAAGSIITNSGTISAGTGQFQSAVRLTNSTVTNLAGGTIIGGRGVSMFGGGSVTNSGAITSNCAPPSFQCGAVVMFNGGTVTNNVGGTISSVGRTIAGQGAATNVVNNGSIVSTYAPDVAVILFAGGSITNNAGATITNTNGYGTYFFGTSASLTNAGTITGNYAVTADGGATGTIGNSGTINGKSFGVGTFGNSAVLLTNNGTITASAGEAVNINAGSVTNQSAGLISSTGIAIKLGTGGTITNDGTVTSSGADAIWSGGALSLTNGGSINGGYAGVTATAGGAIINSGTINGSGSPSGFSYAVQLTGAGSITNQSGGALNGGDGAIALFGNGAITADLQEGSSANGAIVSTGDGSRTLLVNGALGGNYSSAGTGVDTLTLGQTGAMVGAIFGAGDDLFLTQGGTIGGALDGGDGNDRFTADFASGVSSTFDLASLVAFESIAKLGLGSLTLTGTAASPGAVIYAGNGGDNDGLLIFDGTSGLTGDIYVNGAIIRANSDDAFGTGTIHTIDPTVQYAASGTFANNILLSVPAPASADPTRLEALSGSTATLIGAITSDPAADPIQYVTIGGNGTIVLTNTANAWTGTTTIDSGATLQGASDTISGGTIVDNGVLAYVQPSSGTVAKDISGSGTVNIAGLGANEALTFSGTNSVANGFHVLDASAIVLTGSNTASRVVSLDGVNAKVTIASTASLVSTGDVGVIGFGDGNVVDNQGSITGGTAFGVALYGGSSTLINGSSSNSAALVSGDIGGASSAGSSMTVQNYGTIFGRDYSGIDGGNLTITNYAGGQIIGRGDLSQSGSYGVIAVGTLKLDNAGQIVGRFAGVQSNGAIDLSNSGLIGSGSISGTTFSYSDGNDGVRAFGGGTIDNLAGGQILGSISGIYTTGAALGVTNAGTINGADAGGNGGYGIFSDGSGLTLHNLQGGTVNGATVGLDDNSGGGLAITNAGTISGGTYGIINRSASATIDNLAGGQITGVAGVLSVADFTLTNDGIVSGDAIGISASGGGTIVNHLGGSITADSRAAISANGALTLNNSGTIRTNATNLYDGVTVANGAAASIVNSGTISAATASAIAVTGASTIVNSGTLTGGSDATYGYGMQFATGSSGSFTNQAGGTVGGGAGSVVLRTDNAVGIDLQAGSLANGAIVSTAAGARNVQIAGSLNGIYNASGGTGIDTVTLASTGSFGGGALGAGNDSFTTFGGAIGNTLDGGPGSDSITFNNTNNVSYLGFTNFETGTKLGSGRVTLTGASSIGALAVNAGRLDVNGALASAVTVGNGATLGGTGQVTGSLTIGSGGSLAPGGSSPPPVFSDGIHTEIVFVPLPTYSTFTVNGPLTFNAGSFYDVDISPTQSDHTVVNGTTTLNGGTVRVNGANGTYNPLTVYTIIQSSGGVSGTFAGVTDNLAYLDTSLTYTANTVNLEARRNDIIFSAVADNPNQASVANAVQSIGSGALYDKILVQTADGARLAYDALSGEVYASTQTAILGQRDRLQDAMASNRLRTDGMGLWLDAGRSWGIYDATTSRGNAHASTTTNDLLGGFNWTRGPLAVTVAGGRVFDKLKVEDRSSHAKAKSWLLGGQLAYGADLGLHAVVGGNYAWHKVSTNRSVVFPGLAESESSTRAGNGYHLFGQLGYAAQMSGVTIEPFVGVARDHLKLGNVSETGGMAALDVRSASRSLTTSQLGLKLATAAHFGWGTFTPRTSIAWQHVMGDRNGRLDAGFQAGGLDYSIVGTALARDAAKVGLDFDFDFGAAKVVAGYTGTLAGSATQHTAKIAFQLKF